MLVSQTIENLHALELPEMAAGLREQCEQAQYHALPFEERLGMLVDRELTERENRRLARYLKHRARQDVPWLRARQLGDPPCPLGFVPARAAHA